MLKSLYAPKIRDFQRVEFCHVFLEVPEIGVTPQVVSEIKDKWDKEELHLTAVERRRALESVNQVKGKRKRTPKGSG